MLIHPFSLPALSSLGLSGSADPRIFTVRHTFLIIRTFLFTFETFTRIKLKMEAETCDEVLLKSSVSTSTVQDTTQQRYKRFHTDVNRLVPTLLSCLAPGASHWSPLCPLPLSFLCLEIVFVEQDIPLERQQWLLCHRGSTCFLVLGQDHGTEQRRVEDVAHRRLRKRLKIPKLLLHVFGNQPPVMVHNLVHFFDLAFCFSCQHNQIMEIFLRCLWPYTSNHTCNEIISI